MNCRFKFQNRACAFTVLVMVGLASGSGVAAPGQGGHSGGGRSGTALGGRHSTTASASVQACPARGSLPPCGQGQVQIGGRCYCVHRPAFIYSDFFFCPFWWYPGYPYGVYEEVYGLSYEQWGRKWGKDLAHGSVTMEQVTKFLREQVVSLPDPLRDDFQRGFVKGYGKKGAAVLAQAMSQAKENGVQQRDEKGTQAVSSDL